jgi:hypothetical protein
MIFFPTGVSRSGAVDPWTSSTCMNIGGKSASDSGKIR